MRLDHYVWTMPALSRRAFLHLEGTYEWEATATGRSSRECFGAFFAAAALSPSCCPAAAAWAQSRSGCCRHCSTRGSSRTCSSAPRWALLTRHGWGDGPTPKASPGWPRSGRASGETTCSRLAGRRRRVCWAGRTTSSQTRAFGRFSSAISPMSGSNRLRYRYTWSPASSATAAPQSFRAGRLFPHCWRAARSPASSRRYPSASVSWWTAALPTTRRSRPPSAWARRGSTCSRSVIRGFTRSRRTRSGWRSRRWRDSWSSASSRRSPSTETSPTSS